MFWQFAPSHSYVVERRYPIIVQFFNFQISDLTANIVSILFFIIGRAIGTYRTAEHQAREADRKAQSYN